MNIYRVMNKVYNLDFILHSGIYIYQGSGDLILGQNNLLFWHFKRCHSLHRLHILLHICSVIFYYPLFMKEKNLHRR